MRHYQIRSLRKVGIATIVAVTHYGGCRSGFGGQLDGCHAVGADVGNRPARWNVRRRVRADEPLQSGRWRSRRSGDVRRGLALDRFISAS